MFITPHSLIKDSIQLASPPTVYNKLNSLVKDDNSSAENISAVINTDPALAIRLLKLVNSSYYGFPSQITTISRAITIIGTTELTNLVLATSVVNSFNDIPSSLLNINDFWHHSLSCAIASTYLAQHSGQRATERFFILGLLHNIGSLVICQSIPDLAKDVLMNVRFDDEIIYEAEQRIIGFDHTEAGQALADFWHLPPLIAEVIRHHHSPAEAKSFPIETAIVHLADIIVSTAQLGNTGKNNVAPLSSEAWETLGLDEKILPDIVEQINSQLSELMTVMTTT